jgi:hypothetical protein
MGKIVRQQRHPGPVGVRRVDVERPPRLLHQQSISPAILNQKNVNWLRA